MGKKSESKSAAVSIKTKDLKPKKDAKGGVLPMPPVQKVRAPAARGV